MKRLIAILSLAIILFSNAAYCVSSPSNIDDPKKYIKDSSTELTNFDVDGKFGNNTVSDALFSTSGTNNPVNSQIPYNGSKMFNVDTPKGSIQIKVGHRIVTVNDESKGEFVEKSELTIGHSKFQFDKFSSMGSTTILPYSVAQVFKECGFQNIVQGNLRKESDVYTLVLYTKYKNMEIPLGFVKYRKVQPSQTNVKAYYVPIPFSNLGNIKFKDGSFKIEDLGKGMYYRYAQEKSEEESDHKHWVRGFSDYFTKDIIKLNTDDITVNSAKRDDIIIYYDEGKPYITTVRNIPTGCSMSAKRVSDTCSVSSSFVVGEYKRIDRAYTPDRSTFNTNLVQIKETVISIKYFFLVLIRVVVPFLLVFYISLLVIAWALLFFAPLKILITRVLDYYKILTFGNLDQHTVTYVNLLLYICLVVVVTGVYIVFV